MKKRSLFAAVAMLIVSAIVLTSATYAWFASNSNATVGKIGASVTNADGSLLVKATGDYAKGDDFEQTLDDSDWPTIPKVLYPVSFTLSNDGGTAGRYSTISDPIRVAYDGTAFTAGSARTAREYQVYSFDVQYKTSSTTAKTVTLTPTVDRGACDFAYIYVKTTFGSNVNGYLYAGGDQYYPVANSLAGNSITDVKDTNTGKNNAIIDTTDGSTATGYLGSQVTSLSSTSAITLMNNMTATATTEGEGDNAVTTYQEATYTASVTVYVWAEGNDSDCTGPQNASNIGVSFELGAA